MRGAAKGAKSTAAKSTDHFLVVPGMLPEFAIQAGYRRHPSR